MIEGPQLTLPVIPGPTTSVGPVFVAFEYSGKPPHKARHRSRIVYPRGGKPFISNYPDPVTKAHEEALAQLARIYMRGRAPTARPVALLVHAFIRVPESWPGRDREAALAGALRPTGRPDFDNYAKVASDALNTVVWLDDSQVVDGRCIKLYSAHPALRIEVREFLEPDHPLAQK